MIVTMMHYEQITSMIDLGDGVISYQWRENGYCGSFKYEDNRCIFSIITAARCYVMELDITPDNSPENAAYWIDRLFRAFIKMKKGHKAVATFAKETAMTLALYSSDTRYHKHFVEYYRYGQ